MTARHVWLVGGSGQLATALGLLAGCALVTGALFGCGSERDSAAVAGSGGGSAGAASGSASGGSGGCIGEAGTGETAAVCDELPGKETNCNLDADPFVPGPDYRACQDAFHDMTAGAAEAFAACLPRQSNHVCTGADVQACREEVAAASCVRSAAQAACDDLMSGCHGDPIDTAECAHWLSLYSEPKHEQFRSCLETYSNYNCVSLYARCRDDLDGPF
jgi:hypothetical protein